SSTSLNSTASTPGRFPISSPRSYGRWSDRPTFAIGEIDRRTREGTMDSSDNDAIKAIIDRQFASLNWSPGADANWDAFLSDFTEDAWFNPSARPPKPQTSDAFVTRMKRLAAGPLRSFQESALGCEIRVYGNIAVAVAPCQITENEAEVSRSVEMMLLVKS